MAFSVDGQMVAWSNMASVKVAQAGEGGVSVSFNYTGKTQHEFSTMGQRQFEIPPEFICLGWVTLPLATKLHNSQWHCCEV